MKINKFVKLDEFPLSFNLLLNYSNKNNYIKKLKIILKKDFNKKSVIFVRNGRTGLLESLRLIGLKKSDEVLIPAYTSIPVLLAVKNICRPIFVDINPYDSNINPDEILKKISSKTKAIIVVHNYGKSANMKEILEIAKRKNLAIIEDLAQAPYGKYMGKMLGTFGDYTVFSFGPGKDITSYIGGAILFNGKETIYNNICYTNSFKCFSVLSFIKLYYYFLSVGLSKNLIKIKNNLLTPIQRNKLPKANINRNEITNYIAYLVFNQIKKIETIIEIRRKNATFYMENLNPGIINPKTMKLDMNTFYRFTIQLRHRERLIKQGLREGIEFGNMYNYCLAQLPNSKKACKMNINIPVHQNLKYEDLNRVVSFLNKSVYLKGYNIQSF